VSINHVARLAELVDGQPITEADAEGWIPKTCFKHGPPGRVGIELEFLVHEDRDHGADDHGGDQADPGPARHLGRTELQRLFDDLDAQPLHSKFTVEPGGQVELSSLPASNISDAISLLEPDLALLTNTLRRHGAILVGAGIDPLPPPPRHLRGPRYTQMEAYLDRWGRAGRAMMRSTASVQVNLEAGRIGRGPDDLRRRWDLLHAIGPTLAAAFANSPSYPAADPGWAGFANLRPGVWLTLDPARCRAPQILPTESLPDAWTRWALDAPVLLIRRPDKPWTAPAGLSFRHWLRDGRQAVPDAEPPTLSDLRYHLTTLFPPVRARGHLEVRYVDAQPGRWWRVPAAALAVLVDDDVAGDAARAACEPLTDRWLDAGRTGLADPQFERAARQVLAAAADALSRDGRPELAELTADYLDRRRIEQRDPSYPTTLEGRPC
jgi:glutamate--cysteine ligase